MQTSIILHCRASFVYNQWRTLLKSTTFLVTSWPTTERVCVNFTNYKKHQFFSVIWYIFEMAWDLYHGQWTGGYNSFKSTRTNCSRDMELWESWSTIMTHNLHQQNLQSSCRSTMTSIKRPVLFSTSGGPMTIECNVCAQPVMAPIIQY